MDWKIQPRQHELYELEIMKNHVGVFKDLPSHSYEWVPAHLRDKIPKEYTDIIEKASNFRVHGQFTTRENIEGILGLNPNYRVPEQSLERGAVAWNYAIDPCHVHVVLVVFPVGNQFSTVIFPFLLVCPCEMRK